MGVGVSRLTTRDKKEHGEVRTSAGEGVILWEGANRAMPGEGIRSPEGEGGSRGHWGEHHLCDRAAIEGNEIASHQKRAGRGWAGRGMKARAGGSTAKK